MKTSYQTSTVIVFAMALIFGFVGLNTAQAQLAPGFLGLTETYSVFGDAGITGGAAASVWGDVGEHASGDGSINGQQAGTYYPAAQPLVVSDRTSAYGDLVAETPTGSVDLSTPTSVGPGVYTVVSSTFNQTLTLTGAGTYVFQRASNIAQTAGGTMILTGGACASDVYWQTSTGMTFAGPGNIEGTILAAAEITFADSSLTFKGRALAGTNVDLGGITITEPTACNATLHVVKVVSGGTLAAADFDINVTLGVTDVAGSPAVGSDSPGTAYILDAVGGVTYVVSEAAYTGYTTTYSGACDASGNVTLDPGEDVTCTVTNTFGAPAVVTGDSDIKVEKTASDYKLNLGPKKVTFTYKVTNEGDVALTDISVKDDKCDDVDYVSGDDDDDDELDVDEEWKYTCEKTVRHTETNEVTAKGTANGERVKDTDTAKVVVSVPGLPSAGFAPDNSLWDSILTFFSF